MEVNKKRIYELAGLILVTLFLYWPSFSFDFVNYDDQVYILNNSFILDPSFTTLMDGTGTGNFHPITMLTLGLDHWLGNQSAGVFHISNVIWHVLNSILVYLFVSRLFSKPVGAAFFVALIFAVHPMHIESVAWISSRKDLVYTFFYLASLILYFDYLKSKNKSLLVAAILVGLISIFSKPSAITLPIALLILNFSVNRKVDFKSVIPLTPVFLGSVFVGIMTLQLQGGEAVNDLETYSILERIGFAFYGVFYYTFKSIVPTGLAAMHPYPLEAQMVEVGFLLPMLLGVAIVAIVAVAGFGIKKNKDLLFPVLFYFLNLVLMLQLVSIGRAIVSESIPI